MKKISLVNNFAKRNGTSVESATSSKSYGTSTKLGVSADIEVPIVRTGKPVVTVVEPKTRTNQPIKPVSSETYIVE